MKRLAFFILLILTGSLLPAQSGCHLDPSDLQPVIRPFNPFYTDHEWNGQTKVESARLEGESLLVISQHGCKRHHTIFSLFLPSYEVYDNPGFWSTMVRKIFRTAYYEDPVYLEFRNEFEETFSRKYALYGPNNEFNFPIGTRNFICEVQFRGSGGGKIRIEMIEYIFREEVRKVEAPPSDTDDGWFGVDRDQ